SEVCYGPCKAASEQGDCHGHDGVVCGQVIFSFGGADMERFSVQQSCTLLSPPCQRDKDCAPTGGACSLTTDPRDARRLITSCLPPQGPARSAGPCQTDSDCPTGLCLSGFCFAACAT